MSASLGRMYAAKWFMGAASVACALLLALFLVNEPPPSLPELLLKALVLFAAPVIITGAWGATLGATILEPATTRGVGRAALIGLAVSGASFVSYVLTISLCLGGPGFNFAEDFLKVFILLMVYGTVFVGWLVGILGALAGALLYQRIAGERVTAGGKRPL